jgi:hypothetical protein
MEQVKVLSYYVTDTYNSTKKSEVTQANDNLKLKISEIPRRKIGSIST